YVTIHHVLEIAELFTGRPSGNSRHSRRFAELAAQSLEFPITPIPRAATGIAQGLMPVGYGLSLARFQNGSFGYDSRTSKHAIGFRVYPKRRIAVAAALNVASPMRIPTMADTGSGDGGHPRSVA